MFYLDGVDPFLAIEILEKARDRVNRHWVQGKFAEFSQYATKYENCNVCLEGAINWAANGSPYSHSWYPDRTSAPLNDKRSLAALEVKRTIEGILLVDRKVEFESDAKYIPRFNDDPDTTKSDVVTLVDEALKILKEKADACLVH
jgi:hypothetical protein